MDRCGSQKCEHGVVTIWYVRYTKKDEDDPRWHKAHSNILSKRISVPIHRKRNVEEDVRKTYVSIINHKKNISFQPTQIIMDCIIELQFFFCKKFVFKEKGMEQIWLVGKKDKKIIQVVYFDEGSATGFIYWWVEKIVIRKNIVERNIQI